MIVYENTSQGFLQDVLENRIEDCIERAFIPRFGQPGQTEKISWRNSMGFMQRAITRAGVAGDCGILIEYNIPAAGRTRIDFIIAGQDENNGKNFIIVELKQWDWAKSTHKSGVVKAPLRGSKDGIETTHPSYQAYSYKMFMSDFKESIYQGGLTPYSCAYLHNYREGDPEPLTSAFYKAIVNDTPIYFKDDSQKLAEFIARFVGKGAGKEILYEIEKGRIRPSRKLVDHVCGLFKGNSAFVLIDEQKVAYETAVDLALHAKKKTVLLIKGGPGTGKSVVSMNVLGAVLSDQSNVAFVAPNASFRNVMVHSLARENPVTRLRNLFKGSSSFYNVDTDTYDVLIVDEAHRLKNGSAYQYFGDNQIEDIVKAARVSIFFIDDDQKIRPEDIGSVNEIKKVSAAFKADIHEIELAAQFRCSGADGYINWLDDVLQIRPTGNFDGWDRGSFEFKIFDDPKVLYKAIKAKDISGSKARLLAGYAWPWTKEGNIDANVNDVVIPEFNFGMPWNSRQVGTTWAIDSEGVDQIGCIHTSQGLEFDYVGVIVGSDLRFDKESNGFVVDWGSYKDRNGKKGLRNKPEQLSRLVRNIYKTLMTRGMRGCYVYIVDKEVEAYFRSRLTVGEQSPLLVSDIVSPVEEAQFLLEESIENHLKFKEYLPVYTLEAACGLFGQGVEAEEKGWIKVDGLRLNKNMFVSKVVGKSMEPRIPGGSYCIFQANVVGPRGDLIVLVQWNTVLDVETGGKYTVKKYMSRKKYNLDDTWSHDEIVLLPLNSDFEPIVIPSTNDGELMVVARFIEVLGKG